MATSAIFDVITALVELADETLTSVRVYDGFGVSDDPGDFLMIGVEDPDLDSAATSGGSQQEWAHANFTARDETGEITCAALSWNGEGDQRAAREAVRDTLAAFAAAIRENPSLGLSSVMWTSYGTDTQLLQAQGESGAEALVIFKVMFRARLNTMS